MNDNDQDRSQSEGQEGIDRETEQRNRENESGQSGGQQFGQQQGQSDSGQSQGGQQFGQQQGGDAALSERTGQTGGQSSSGEAGGFVGSRPEDSSDYLTKGQQDQDFAPEGQGAQDTDAGKSDVETGQSQDRASGLDDGSDSNR